ncbi:MAG: DUF3656 domain-containing protein [Thermodesulfobacteriota bacterium]
MKRATRNSNTTTSRKSAKPSRQLKKPELLAPAGGLAAFFAALEAGADAVYCGLENFSARAKAKNFSLSDLTAMASYAHQHGKKIYVALNTLIKEAEIPLLIETLGQLQYAGIDGIIVQDLSLWRLVRNHFPDLYLHASTQMTVHNAAGVNMLAGMGFKRVVLARELSLAEISLINRQTNIELEHFVHGALCFSISGQCLFSSSITGKSGNRGRCAQPCRRRYNYRDKPGYYFSTSDLCAIDHLPQLIEAGITTFKIEGRMKSAEYVGRVVTAYRMVLDGPARERRQVLTRAKQQLELSFGRKSTTGFLTGQLPTAIAAPARQGTIGQYLGLIKTIRGKTIFVTLEGKLHIGDRLKVMPQNDQTGAGLTVISMKINQKKVKAAVAGATVTIETQAAEKISPGDAVYKVAAEQSFSASEAACRQKLARVQLPHPALYLKIALSPDRLTIYGEVSGIKLERSYTPKTSPAKDRPLDETLLSRIFAKTSTYPFILKKLTAPNLPDIFIPTSKLNEIRRDFFQQLATEIVKTEKRKRHQQHQEVMATLLPKTTCQAVADRHLTATVAAIRDIKVLDTPLVNRVAVPLTPENVRNQSKLSRTTASHRQEIIWDIPAIIFPDDWPQFKSAVKQLLSQGFSSFRLNNIGHFLLFDKATAAKLIAGSQLYSMNSETIRAWQELGINEITLPIENDRQNLGELMARKTTIPICQTIYTPIPLMTSRIPLRGIKSGSRLFSDKGDSLQLTTDHGLTVLTGSADFSLLEHLTELQASGCNRLHIDLAHCGPFSVKGRAVLNALANGENLQGTTAFNFERGLE